jgi:DivIVA domain-containing protein
VTTMFRTVGRFSKGYNPEQVEEFFARARRSYEGDRSEMIDGHDVRRAAFDLVRHGYDPTAVDAALDRLERAFTARRRADFVAANGQDSWMEHLAGRARTLYDRLRRPDGDRFARARRGEQGYDPDDVDEICHRLVDYFDHGAALTSEELRHATFGAARGRRAYAEGPVDAFLDRAMEVLIGVE